MTADEREAAIGAAVESSAEHAVGIDAPTATPDHVAALTGSDVGRIARSGLWSVLAYAVTAISAFASSIVVARAIGPEALGRYGLYVFLLRLVPTVVAFGVPRALTVVMAEQLGAGRPEAARALLRQTARLHALMLPAAGILVGLGVRAVEGSWAIGAAVAVGVVVVGATLDTEAALTAFGRFKELSVTAFIGALAQVAAAIIGYSTGIGWPGFTALFIAASAVALLAQAHRTTRVISTYEIGVASPEDRSRFLGLIFVVGFSVALNEVVWGPIELLFLGWWRPPADLGHYSAAVRLASLPALLPLMFSRVLLPEFSRLRGAGDDEGLQRVFPEVCTLLMAVAAPVALGGAALAGTIVTVVYGKDFSAATPAATVLFAASAVNALVGPATTAVMIGPRPRLIAQVGIVAAVLLVLSDWVLISRYGPVGAASSTVAVQIVCVSIGLGFAWRSMGLAYPVLAVARVLAMAGTGAAAAWVVDFRIDEPITGLLAGLFTGAAVYLGLVSATRTIQLRDVLRRAPSPD